MPTSPLPPTGQEPAVPPESEPDELGWAGPSRSQVKREAEAVTKLGQKLTALPTSALQQLPLTPELFEAIELYKRLKKGAQARQLRRIGSLMRSIDLGPIAEAFGKGSGSGPEERQIEQLGEVWRTRLLEGGDTEVEAFLTKYPHGDRTHLRQLLRASRGEPTDDRIKRAKRELLRRLRDWLKGPELPA